MDLPHSSKTKADALEQRGTLWSPLESPRFVVGYM